MLPLGKMRHFEKFVAKIKKNCQTNVKNLHFFYSFAIILRSPCFFIGERLHQYHNKHYINTFQKVSFRLRFG